MRILILLLLANTALGQSFYSTVTGSCASDGQVELGTKFTTSANATITALRFYKCSPGTEIYTLKLYSGTTLLTSGTYTGTATGWINVTIPSVSIIPGVNYTVSYYASTGRYQAVSTYSYPVTNGTLTATGSVYGYKSTNNNTVPTLTFQTSNYFADVVVQGALPPSKGDTVYIRDTIVRTVLVHDTITSYCPDSSWIFMDGANPDIFDSLPPQNHIYEQYEITMPFNQRIRWSLYIQRLWKRELSKDNGVTWEEK